jgi:hypothetical protein
MKAWMGGRYSPVNGYMLISTAARILELPAPYAGINRVRFNASHPKVHRSVA